MAPATRAGLPAQVPSASTKAPAMRSASAWASRSAAPWWRTGRSVIRAGACRRKASWITCAPVLPKPSWGAPTPFWACPTISCFAAGSQPRTVTPLACCRVVRRGRNSFIPRPHSSSTVAPEARKGWQTRR